MKIAHIKQFDLSLKRRFDPVHCTLEDYRSCDEPMRQCLEMAWRVARTELPILILGESGTGKTLLARAIHNSSARLESPFVAFNAAALSETLLDSQLFGHERGAFTGAQKRVKGKFELAHRGTLFFDEIADMSPSAQAKILRAVEYGEFERLGSEELKVADVRVISATHLSREELILNGFRRDLLYRLSGVAISIPPLKDRPYDLPFLVAAEIDLACRQLGKRVDSLSQSAALRLFSHSWPGNLRELNRVIRIGVALCEGPTLRREDILLDDAVRAAGRAASGPADSQVRDEPEGDWSLRGAMQRHILRILERTGGNKKRAAALLGISRSTLDRRLNS